MPVVSIGLPVRNGEAFLSQALDSILAQTFGDFEVLISDNASNDSTEEIAREYCQRDPRISYQRQPENIGAAKNFNYVFEQSSAPYFRWASYDDIMAPTYLASCLSALEADNSGAVLAFPKTMMIDSSGLPLRIYAGVKRKGGTTPSERLYDLIGPGDRTHSHLHMCFPIFGLIRREALRDTSLIANMPRSDNLLLVQLALKGPFLEIDEPLFLRREHDAGSVISAEKQARRGEDVERLLAAWFDPQRGRAFPATRTRLATGYLLASLKANVSWRERYNCAAISLAWACRNWRVIGGECKIVLFERTRVGHFGAVRSREQ